MKTLKLYNSQLNCKVPFMSSNTNALEIQSYDDKEKMFLVKSPKGNIVKVQDTFAEMFPLWVGRVLITAQNEKWAQIAASLTTGFATSVIEATAEAAIERTVPADQTPDKRPGVLIQIYNRDRFELKHQLMQRIGQCTLTCPTTAAFNGLDWQTNIRCWQQPTLFRRWLPEKSHGWRKKMLENPSYGRQLHR